MKIKKLKSEKKKLSEEEARIQKVKNKLINKVKAQCSSLSLRSMELALEVLQKQKTALPTELSVADHIKCYEAGIARYKEGLKFTGGR